MVTLIIFILLITLGLDSMMRDKLVILIKDQLSQVLPRIDEKEEI